MPWMSTFGQCCRQRRLHAVPVGAFNPEAAAGAHDWPHAANQPGWLLKLACFGVLSTNFCHLTSCLLTPATLLAAQVTFSPDGRWIVSASFDKSGACCGWRRMHCMRRMCAGRNCRLISHNSPPPECSQAVGWSEGHVCCNVSRPRWASVPGDSPAQLGAGST